MYYPSTISLTSHDVTHDCGSFGVTFFSDAAGTVPLDSTVFTVVSETTIQVYTEDPSKAGTYDDVSFTVHLVDYPSAVSAARDVDLEIVIVDRCTVEGGLAFTTSPYLSQPGPYYFVGSVVSIDAVSNLVTNYLTECPILAFECTVYLPDLASTINCDQNDGGGTTVSIFDPATGVFEFQSSNPLNSLYENGSLYTV